MAPLIAIRVLLSLEIARGWSIRQIDINNAFFHGTLYENVSMSQPPAFIDTNYPHYVYKPKKLFMVSNRLLRLGTLNYALTFFTCTSLRHNLILHFFCLSWGGGGVDVHAYLLVYVDDIIFTCSDPHRVYQLVAQLVKRFSLKDLCQLQYFLGVEISTHFLLSQ